MTEGYPYLIQLVGYYLWEELDTPGALERVSVYVKQAMFQNVHQLIYQELSPTDQLFLKAMAKLGNTVKISDVMEERGRDKNTVSTYRSRLIATGVIETSGHGLVSFVLPYMFEFLSEQQ